MSSLTAPGFLDALRTLLLARAHMVADPTIAVYTGPIGPDTANPRMAIVFVSVEDRLEPAALGPQTQVTQSERYTVDGLAAGISPLKGETGIKAARDACLLLLAELNQQLREDMTVSGTVEWAYLATVHWDQGLDADRGRICVATFGIEVKARIPATPAGSWT